VTGVSVAADFQLLSSPRSAPRDASEVGVTERGD
jgi:hypothetical protein